jgi:hypothetical protein
VLGQMMPLTLYAYSNPLFTKRALQQLMGIWTFCLCYRRSIFACVYALHKDTERLGKKASYLGGAARDELLYLLILAPLMRQSMRWPVAESLF